MWQKHKMVPWEFASLHRRKRAFLVASELIQRETDAKALKSPKK